MAREFPIANGKLVTDLDANGFKIVNAQGGGGGSGGTTDYNDLDNKPKINGVEISGRKSADDYGLATKEQLNAVKETAENKRNRTDNIAAKDETMLSEWKCVCDNPFVQAYIDEQPPTVREFYPDEPGMTPWFTVIFTEGIFTIQGQVQVQCVGGDYPYDVPDGQLDHVTEMTFDRVYYVSPYVGTPEVWGDPTSVEVRFTRTKVFTTKSGEPYVTPTGVGVIAPKTELHALTPEVTDTTVTLKPVDGAANWVNRTVMVSGGVEKNLSFDLSASIDYYPITPEDELPSNMPHGIFIEPRAVLSTDNAVVEDVAQIDYEYYEISIKILKPVEIQYNENQYVNDPKSIGFPSHAAAGTDIYCHTGDLTFDCESDIKDCSFTASSVDSVWGLWDGFPDRITYNGEEYLHEGLFDSSRNLTQTIVKHYKDLHIALPDSTDHARSFSLALTTDATAETAVTWEGADEIIEAFPGSSKLIPGEIIWDVKEVAPGKFRVDRASSPAQSAPLTLTAPNGRVAELAVGDDLVLEVKEK